MCGPEPVKTCPETCECREAREDWIVRPDCPDVPSGFDRVVFDLDGTLAHKRWPSPEVGPPMVEGVELLYFYASDGYEVIIHTARPASHEKRIWEWLIEHRLDEFVYDVVCGKPVAGLYIDDRAWRPLYTEIHPQ